MPDTLARPKYNLVIFEQKCAAAHFPINLIFMVVDLDDNSGKDLFVDDYPAIFILFDLFHHFVQLRCQGFDIVGYDSPGDIDLADDLVRVGLGMKTAMGFNLGKAGQLSLFGINCLF